ncbi:MAG: hypothetical protein N2D54_02510 [Chloroflexota bacterium]
MLRKSMKLIVLGLALIIVLAACGGNQTANTQGETSGLELAGAGGRGLAEAPVALDPGPSASLVEFAGSVQVKAPGDTDFISATSGYLLTGGAQLQTLNDGRARVDFADGTILRISSDSLFTLISPCTEIFFHYPVIRHFNSLSYAEIR